MNRLDNSCQWSYPQVGKSNLLTCKLIKPLKTRVGDHENKRNTAN